MTQNTENNSARAKSSALLEVLLAIAAAAVILLLLAAFCRGLHEAGGADRTVPLNDGWYYMEQEEKVPVSLPAVLQLSGGRPLILYNDDLPENSAGMCLTTRGAVYNLQASLNGKTLYAYSDPAFPRNDQMKSKHDCDISIPADYQSGTLALTYENTKNGSFKIPAVYFGTGSAVVWQHIEAFAATMGLAFLFILLGVLALGICIYLRCSRIPGRRFLDTALFLFVCSLWFITDSSIVQNRSSWGPVICMVSFCAFMLLAVPMLYFVRNTAGMSKYAALTWLIRLFYLNGIIQGVLYLLFGIPFKDMLLATHLLLFGGVIITGALLLKEYRLQSTREIRMILAAFSVLGASGILSLILYWLLEIPYYGNIFEFGILCFVVLILSNIIMTMAENIHYKTESQVSLRLSREDRMTGMPNQAPFEERISEIQRTAGTFDDAMLLFVRPRPVQEADGAARVTVKDETMVAMARCITAVFGRESSCYCLFNEEFAVICTESGERFRDRLSALDAEILQYNKTGRLRFTAACGFSPLKNPDGSCKSADDWKYDAHYRLYKDRGRLIHS